MGAAALTFPGMEMLHPGVADASTIDRHPSTASSTAWGTCPPSASPTHNASLVAKGTVKMGCSVQRSTFSPIWSLRGALPNVPETGSPSPSPDPCVNHRAL